MDVLKTRPIRILIADDETLISERMIIFLNEKGFECKYVKAGMNIANIIPSWMPDFIIYDLMLPDMNGLEFLRQMRQANLLGSDKVKVFITSTRNVSSNVKECLKLGASDYLIKPIKHPDLFMRLVLHMQAKKEINDVKAGTQEIENAQYYLHLVDLLLRESLKPGHLDDLLHKLTMMVGMSMKAVRVSLIECDADARSGWVVASSDNSKINRLKLDLFKYPEILYVLRNEKMLALDNLAADPTMHFVTRQNKEITFNSMIVAPIKISGTHWGVLSIKMADSKQQVNEFEMRYAQLAAHVMGLQLRPEPIALRRAE